MKRVLALIFATIFLAGTLVTPSPATASAAVRYPGDPIPGCQYRAIPPAPVYWQGSLNFFYSGRYRTSNGTCSRDAIRFFLDYFSNSPFDCARVWIRTFNSDGTTRRVWDSQPICPGQERAFINVDNNRAFRVEIRSNDLQAAHNIPVSAFSF
jgi:hypothetical protein